MDKLMYFLGEVNFSLVIGQNGHWRVVLKIKKVKYLGLQLHEIEIWFQGRKFKLKLDWAFKSF